MMSIKYKVVKQTFGFDKTKKPHYVVKPVTTGVLTFDRVRAQVMQVCGAHRGTVNQVIDGLIDVMINNLEMGHSVQLGEFGTIRPGIRAKAKTREADATAESVYRRKVNFVPGKLLKNFLQDVSISKIEPLKTDYTEDVTSGEL
ncbi:MAG: HU family DNA-binding protein [Tannerellaceae bacterium]|jgi:predicted histone-like DNA-binding protein|nr:HU family DNA-binding protein [Tannerellaceae bacterium]